MSDKTQSADKPLHWLARPKTIKMLWVVGILTLIAVTGLSLTVPHPDVKFGLEGTPAFYSWYGFAACVGLVLFAKVVLGKLLSRRDTYYDD